MDKIIEKFYNGSIPNGGNNKPRLTSNKFSSPNLLENRYNRTNENNKYNLRYSNGQKIMENAPVPRTQYSMGLNTLTIRGNPPMMQSATNPFRVTDEPYSTLTKNYSLNKYKLGILDNRIREMEDENKRNKLKIKRLMEGSYFAPEKPYWNSNPNYVNNPNNINEAIDNLRNPYLTMDEYKAKQDMRRNIVQYELEKARQRLNNNNNEMIMEQPIQKDESEKNYIISNDNTTNNEESESNTEELEKMSKEYKKLIKDLKKEKEYNDMYENGMSNIEEKMVQMERQNNYNNEELNLLKQKNQEMYNILKSKEEAEDFMNNIPDHVALQLQNDNFKIRSNLNTIKEGFRQIKNDLENKLESLELKQNYNFEVIKKIIEEGGNRRMKAGFRKYINNEDIDLNSIKNELPEHLQYLPDIIEQKIKENEELKNREKNRIINEQMNNMMDYKYGYANNFYRYKNNYKSNNNFVISKNYGRFQYIPNKNNNKHYNYNNNIYRKDSFKPTAQQNLMIIKGKEQEIPGLYAYGVGNKNMSNRIPIKMNGCYDDWFKDKNSGDFQIEETLSDVGITAIKKQIDKKTNKSLSLKSKTMKKIESSKSEKDSKEKKEKDKKGKKKEGSDEDSGEESGEESDEEDDKKDKKEKGDKKEGKDDKKDKESGSESGSDESYEDSDKDKEGSKKGSKKESGSGSDSDSDSDSD